MPRKKPARFFFKDNPAYDTLLIDIVNNSHLTKWTAIANRLELRIRLEDPFSNLEQFPTGKQCRERWVEHLDPKVSREPFTPAQLAYINITKSMGASYAAIAKELNHPANQVKNAYYSSFPKQKKLSRTKVAKRPIKEEPPEPVINFGFFSLPPLFPGLEELAQELLETPPSIS